jgi:hypothetical protein
MEVHGQRHISDVLLWGKEFCMQWLEGWIGHRAGVDVAMEGKISAPAGN